MFPVGAESGLKENDETHDLWVNLEPIYLPPCSSHVLPLFQMKF